MLKKHEDFIREIEEKNIGIEILGEYEGSRILIRCRCKACFENFSLTPHDILAGRNCPKCTKKETLKKITKSHELFMCQLEKINSNIVILEKYNGARSAIQCQCKKCGYIWRSTPDRLLKGAGCPKCAGNARISHEEFVEIVKSVNDKIEIIEKYTNSQNKVSYRCLQCDYIGEMRAAHLKKGHGCPLCSRRRN